MTTTAGMIASRTIDVTEPPIPIDWTIPGVAARGYLTVLAGQAGIGKSTLALQLAEQAGSSQAPSLYLDSENGPDHLRRLSDRLDIDPERVTLVDMGGIALSDPEHVETLGRELLGIGIASLARHRVMGTPVVVIDSLRRMAPGLSENSSDDMAPYIASLSSLARDTRTAVLLIHHRSSKSDAPTLRGSTAIEDQAGMVLTLTASGELLKLAPTLKFRASAPPAPRYYRWHKGRLIDADAPSRAGCAEAVMRELSSGDRLKRTDIAARIGRSSKDGTLRRTLASLTEDGSVVAHDDGTYSWHPSDAA